MPKTRQKIVRLIERNERKLQTAVRRGEESVSVWSLLGKLKEQHDNPEYYSATILLLILMEAIYYGDSNVNVGVYNPELPAMLLAGWTEHQQRRQDLHLRAIA